MNIAVLVCFKIIGQHLRHWRAGNIGALLWKPAVRKIAAGVLGVREINIGNDVNNASVCLLRQALVLTAVTCFHMEDWDVKTLRSNYTQAGVRVTEN